MNTAIADHSSAAAQAKRERGEWVHACDVTASLTQSARREVEVKRLTPDNSSQLYAPPKKRRSQVSFLCILIYTKLAIKTQDTLFIGHLFSYNHSGHAAGVQQKF